MRLATPRCLIRPFVAEDAGSALAYLGDPEVMRYVEPAFTRADTERFIRRAGLCEPPLIHAVELRTDGTLIGHVIFHSWGSALTWELGWVLRRDRWGRGLATELGRALVRFGFDELGLDRIVAEAVPENLASIAVMASVGLTRAPDLDEALPVWSVEAARRPDPRTV